MRWISFNSFWSLVLVAIGSLLGGPVAHAQEKSLTWSWGSSPCGYMLNCDNGCSACNMPREQDPSFFGTQASWLGVSTCPHPTGGGDNVVYSEGWAMFPVPERAVRISGMTLTSMNLDSVIIRHKSLVDGPTMLRISVQREFNGATVVVHEGPITGEYDAVALRDLGCAGVPEGMSMGGFQVTLQAFGGAGGAWLLDNVRVVASPCAVDIVTGIPQQVQDRQMQQGPLFDLLGRPVPERAAPGFHIDQARRVIVY